MALVAVCTGMLFFTLFSTQYQRFYMPSSFLCTFLICLVTLVIFSADSNHVFMTPVTGLVTSFQVSHSLPVGTKETREYGRLRGSS